jgi:hypothetical protein
VAAACLDPDGNQVALGQDRAEDRGDVREGGPPAQHGGDQFLPAALADARDVLVEVVLLRLMLAHAAAGNRASALLVYERCRARLADDLGTSPGAAIQALHLDLLRER